jgi:hypothetical protein
MAEVFIHSNDPINTKIFFKGQIVDADNTVSVNVYDITQDLSVSPAVNPATPIATLTATKDETNIGSYSVFLPTTVTNRNKRLQIDWSYYVEGSQFKHTTFSNVVTPYCNFAEAIEDLNIGTDPSDPNYKSYHELKMAEKYARKIIEDFTGQEFYLYEDQEIAYGVDSDILPLPYKINAIHKVYADDLLLVDNLENINNWGYSPIISETGFGVRLNRADLLDNTVYVANGMVPPTINDLYAGQAFREGIRYRVVGKFGWDYVPDQVEQACIQLMGHYFGKDRMWADRYLKNVSTFDWDFEYSDEAFKGTGCAYADKLLSNFVISSALLI